MSRRTSRVFFFFNDTATTEIYTLSLHDALPILTRMNRVISVDPQSMTVTVEAGVRRKELNRRLGEHGLFLSVDPGADATVGGMAGTNASGSNALEYGSFRNQVLGMEVVLADGRVLRLGSKARKSSSGYALGDLFVGSEGTLGIITELTLMVHALPAVTATARAPFSGVKSAGGAAGEPGGAGGKPTPPRVGEPGGLP